MHPAIGPITAMLYDGVLAPQAWTQGLQALSDQLDAHAFHQVAIRRDDQSLESVVAAVSSAPPPPDKLIEFENHYAALDVRTPVLQSLREGQLMLDHEHFSRATFERAPIYAEFLASVDMRHTAALPLRDGEHTRDFLGFMRHADQRPYGARERNLLIQITPHLVRANRLRWSAAELATEAALGQTVLDTLPQCVAVLGPRGHVRYLNAAAERALRPAAAPAMGLRIAQGRLECSAPAAQVQLARLVAAACRLDGQREGGSLRTHPAQSEHGGGGAGKVVQVLPLQPAHPLAAAWQAIPQALVTWASHEHAPEKAAQLQALLDLSATEARLALHLAAGHSVKEFSLQQGCSWHTARTHAKNLLRKTGCHSQATLVRMVQSLLTH